METKKVHPLKSREILVNNNQIRVHKSIDVQRQVFDSFKLPSKLHGANCSKWRHHLFIRHLDPRKLSHLHTDSD